MDIKFLKVQDKSGKIKENEHYVLVDASNPYPEWVKSLAKILHPLGFILEPRPVRITVPSGMAVRIRKIDNSSNEVIINFNGCASVLTHQYEYFDVPDTKQE